MKKATRWGTSVRKQLLLHEGTHKGWKIYRHSVGTEIGNELGYYYGCHLVWLEKMNTYSPRIQKSIQKLHEAIQAFPMEVGQVIMCRSAPFLTNNS